MRVRIERFRGRAMGNPNVKAQMTNDDGRGGLYSALYDGRKTYRMSGLRPDGLRSYVGAEFIPPSKRR
jgi:hypothetical protein